MKIAVPVFVKSIATRLEAIASRLEATSMGDEVVALEISQEDLNRGFTFSRCPSPGAAF